MKKTNQNKKLVKVLATTIFGVGFVTPVMFSNIAEAANYGAGWSTTPTFTAAQIEAAEAGKSTGASSISNDNCLMINGYRFKVVDNTTTLGKQILTLWSYDAVDHSGTTGFGTSRYSSGNTWGTAKDQTSIQGAYKNNLISTNTNALLTVDPATGKATGGMLYGDEASKNIVYIPYTSTGITDEADVENAYIWIPSVTETRDGKWTFSSDSYVATAQRAIGIASWLRSPVPSSGLRAYRVGISGSVESLSVDSKYLLRPALQILNQTSCVFTTNGDINTEGVFTADGDGTSTSYVLDSSAAQPTFTPASGVTLDGTKIGISTTASTTADYVTTGLLTTNDGTTWDVINTGSNANISYMAQVNSSNLDLKNVGAGTDYNLKIFGMKTADTAVTQLADNAVNGLSRGSDGKIHMKVKDGTTDGINSGVAVTLKNGAVVDLAGDASNAITVDGISGGKLNLGANTYSGTITTDGTATLDVEGNGGTINLQNDNATDVVNIGTLTGTTNLKIDVDMSTPVSDKFVVTNGNGATINLAGINITKDIAASGSGTNAITYATVTGTQPTYKVNGDTGSITIMTNTLKYIFTKGTDGTLSYNATVLTTEQQGSLVKDVLSGTGGSSTLSLTDDMTNAGGNIEIGAGQTNDEVTMNLNGHDMTSTTESTISVGEGKTLNLAGGDGETSTLDAKTNLQANEGSTIALSGDLEIKGEIKGAGEVTNSGNLTVTDASKIQVTGENGIENTGTISLGDSAGAGSSTLGGKITGGTLEIVGNIASDASNIAGDTNNVAAGKTLTLSGGNLTKEITNSGTVTFTGGELGAKVEGGVLNFNTDMTVADASNIAGDTNNVAVGKTLTLTEGTLGGTLTGEGDVAIGDGGVAKTVHATVEQLANDGDVTVARNATLDLTSGTLTKGITNSGTVTFTGGELGAKVEGGTLNFNADMTVADAGNIAGDTNNVAASRTLTLSGGNLTKEITNSGIINLTGAELGAKVEGGILNLNTDMTVTDAGYIAGVTNLVKKNKTLTLKGGTLGGALGSSGSVVIDGDVSANAGYIPNSLNTVTVNSGKVLTLTDGTLSRIVTNNGTIKTNGNVTISSRLNDGTGGKLVVESGKLIYTNTTAGSIAYDVEIKAGATMDPVAGVFATGTTVTNYGTLEITGGTLTATIDGKGGDNLVMEGRMKIGTDGCVKQVAGSRITVRASLIEADSNDPEKAMFTGVDNENKLDVRAGTLTLTGTVQEGKYYVLVAGDAVGTTLTKDNLWDEKNEKIEVDGLFNVEYNTNLTDKSIAIQVTNATTYEELNTSGVAAVQQGAMSMGNEIASSIADNLGVMSRPAVSAGSRAKVRNVASTTKDDHKVEVVEQGNANEVMPVQVVEKEEYDKTVWASYIRTKETTEGMNLGAGLKGDNSAQYNGYVVGVDFYSSKKAIAGVALSYTTGDIDSYSGTTSTRNKSKYYGISFYDRVTNGNTALIYDIGYIRGDNDISQFNNALNKGKEITSDVKTNTYTAGARWEAAIETGKSKIVPFASFRYMRVNNGDYTNSHGVKFETKNQNLYIPKVGIAWTGDFTAPNSVCTWRPSVEAGYVWNLGDRTADSNVLMGTRPAAIEYDTVDKSSYYAKAGLEFIHKNFTAGLFYRYLKGSAVRNNKWNVNVAWSF